MQYTIPFGIVASNERAGDAAGPVRVTLQSGEELQLEPSDDLGDGNDGMLVLAAGRKRPEYVDWADVERIDFGHLPAVYPRADGSRATSGLGTR